MNNMKISSRSYRGTITYILSYDDETGSHSQEFDSELEAQRHARSIKDEANQDGEFQANKAAIGERLAQLNASEEALLKHLDSLIDANVTDLVAFHSSTNSAVACYQSIEAMLPDNAEDPVELVRRLGNLFAQGATIDSLEAAYEKSTRAKRVAEQALAEYLADMMEVSGDEDECEFAEKKLRRFLVGLDYEIEGIEVETIKDWMEGQAGSAMSKANFHDIIDQFLIFFRNGKVEQQEADEDQAPISLNAFG